MTNDAEYVVDELRWKGFLQRGMYLFYYDSDGYLDEITLTPDAKFKGFNIGSNPFTP